MIDWASSFHSFRHGLKLLSKKSTRWLAAPFLLSYLSSCAGSLDLTTNGRNLINDARPPGNPIYQGNFVGASGQSNVTGTALIFLSGSSYTLRLDGLSITNEAALVVNVYHSSGSTPNFLSSSSGNQNYSLPNLPLNSTFTSVEIYSTLQQTNYAIATLIRTGRTFN